MEWRGFGAGDGTGERGRWRGAREGQRSGAEDVDLGGAAGVGTSPGKRREIGGDSGWVAFALVGGAERRGCACGVGVCGCGEEDGEFVPG